MTSTDLAIRGAARGALALTPDQTDWTPEQLAALRQLGIEDAPEGDLLVFRHVCLATGLDPFRKQIYMIGRKTKVSYWDQAQRRKVEDWVMKYTIQTGIDGFRKNGRAAAAKAGDTVRFDGPYWQGSDGGGWQDVWLADSPPAAAKYTIFRDGEPCTGIAMYREFVQTAPGSSDPNSMWRKMPANQLAKCAEAQAWRRAFPDDFSGMQLEDAAQIIDPDGAPAESNRVRSERVSAAGIINARRPAPASELSAKPEAPQTDAPSAPLQEHIDALAAAMTAEGYKTNKSKLAELSRHFGRKITNPHQLTADEVDAYLRSLLAKQHDRAAAEAQATDSAPDLATPEQVQALVAALQRDKVLDEAEQLDWIRNNGAPGLGGFDDLDAHLAVSLTEFLTQAQAKDTQITTGQLPIEGDGGDQ
ncbi:recombinase RecT [Nocardia wallacei]|uniref:recombinase RecT n=1 Tax=Nocardia wallacei TaxID=480035 RepID=UPI0024584DBF|nr:recombinase RecT [Nocardia wallacei]